MPLRRFSRFVQKAADPLSLESTYHSALIRPDSEENNTRAAKRKECANPLCVLGVLGGGILLGLL